MWQNLIMKFKNPLSSAIEKFSKDKEEHSMYEKIANDLDANNIDKGVWTKAFAKSGGDTVKQKALYIELMIEHYKKERAAQEEMEYIKKKEQEMHIRNSAPLMESLEKERQKREYEEKMNKDRERFREEQRKRDEDLRKEK